MWAQYSITFTNVQLYFKENRSIASGIVSGGMALGIVLGPIVTQILLDTFALRGCLLILAGISLQCMITAMLLRPSEREKERNSKTPIYKGNAKSLEIEVMIPDTKEGEETDFKAAILK